MPAHAEPLHLPGSRPIRWLLVPVVGWAVFATVSRALRRRALQPSVPPMSEEWLRSHESEVGRSGGW